LHWPGAGELLIISLFAMTLLYFPLAFYFFCDKSIKRQNLAVSIISGFILAIAPVNILNKLMYWSTETGQLRLLIAVGAVSILLFVILYLKSTSSSDELKIYYKNLFQRTLVICIATVIFYLIPTPTLIKIQYRDDPELARLKTLYYMHPDNAQYRKQYDDYVAKLDSLNRQ
jgi:glucose uptake protein GlcU